MARSAVLLSTAFPRRPETPTSSAGDSVQAAPHRFARGLGRREEGVVLLLGTDRHAHTVALERADDDAPLLARRAERGRRVAQRQPEEVGLSLGHVRYQLADGGQQPL